jgi:hypothetical protein
MKRKTTDLLAKVPDIKIEIKPQEEAESDSDEGLIAYFADSPSYNFPEPTQEDDKPQIFGSRSFPSVQIGHPEVGGKVRRTSGLNVVSPGGLLVRSESHEISENGNTSLFKIERTDSMDVIDMEKDANLADGGNSAVLIDNNVSELDRNIAAKTTGNVPVDSQADNDSGGLDLDNDEVFDSLQLGRWRSFTGELRNKLYVGYLSFCKVSFNIDICSC